MAACMAFSSPRWLCYLIWYDFASNDHTPLRKRPGLSADAIFKLLRDRIEIIDSSLLPRNRSRQVRQGRPIARIGHSGLLPRSPTPRVARPGIRIWPRDCLHPVSSRSARLDQVAVRRLPCCQASDSTFGIDLCRACHQHRYRRAAGIRAFGSQREKRSWSRHANPCWGRTSTMTPAGFFVFKMMVGVAAEGGGFSAPAQALPR